MWLVIVAKLASQSEIVKKQAGDLESRTGHDEKMKREVEVRYSIATLMSCLNMQCTVVLITIRLHMPGYEMLKKVMSQSELHTWNQNLMQSLYRFVHIIITILQLR